MRRSHSMTMLVVILVVYIKVKPCGRYIDQQIYSSSNAPVFVGSQLRSTDVLFYTGRNTADLKRAVGFTTLPA